MFADYFTLALKNVRKRGIRSWLTMLGIFLGIAAVVSLISLGQGLQTAITGQFDTLSTDTLTISSAETGFGPPGSTAVRKLTDHDLRIIEKVPGVKIAIPRLVRVVKVEFNDIVQFRFIGSMPPEQKQLVILSESLNLEIEEGKMLRAGDRGKIVLGSDFITQDDFEKEIRLGTNLEIQGKNFEVIGITKRGSSFILNGVIFMSDRDLKDILDIDDEIDLIVAKVNEENIEQIASDIERKMRRDRDQDPGEEDFAVQTPLQAVSSVNVVLDIVNLVVAGIAAIALLIGGVGIANTMFTSVLERTREIGVMKSVGAKRKDILSLFIIEAGILGLVGGLVGAAIGLGMAFVASLAANAAIGGSIINVEPSIPLLLGAVGFAFVIGVLSGIIPAYQASKLSPVEALRK